MAHVRAAARRLLPVIVRALHRSTEFFASTANSTP